MDRESAGLVKDITIRSYKSYAFLIFEISRQEIITGVWAKSQEQEQYYRQKYEGIRVSDVLNDAIIDIIRQNVQHTFNTGGVGIVEYDTVANDVPTRFLMRFIPATYDNNLLLATVETIAVDKNVTIVEDKWRLALDAAGDGMWDANMVTGKIFFSPKWHEMFGYTESDITNVKDWNEKIHPEDREIAQAKFDEYIKGHLSSYSAEMRYRYKDGSYRWILSRGAVVAFNAEGKPVRILGTHTDIHERKLQEIKYIENEKKYRTLFDHSEAWICTHDMNGVLLNVNPFAGRSLGYRPEEVIGLNLASLIPEPYREHFNKYYLAAIKANGTAEGVMHIMHKNGKTRLLLYKNYLFNLPDIEPYVIGYAQDITDRIKAEDALKQSVDTFSTAFNYSGIGMALVSPAGQWLEVNEALCNMLGYTKNELMSLTFQDITHPEDLQKDISFINQMLDKSIDTYSMEKRYMAKNGKTIWGVLTVSLVWDKKDRPKFFISQIVDITPRKELNMKLTEKNAELEAAQASLLNKITQLEDLSYVIAHNLRGPVRNINLFTDVLRIKFGETALLEDAAIISDSLTTEETIQMVAEAGTSLGSSLEDLLEIAEVRLNKNIPSQVCVFSDVVSDVVSQLKADIVNKHVDIQTCFQVKEILYPHTYLESILYNLVSNAIKYRNPNTSPQIHISTDIHEGSIRLRVKDNGLGIDLSKYADKVFRLNQTFHAHKDSKGIGLYLVKTQIEAMGGSITLNSAVNEGTEFIVMFGNEG